MPQESSDNRESEPLSSPTSSQGPRRRRFFCCGKCHEVFIYEDLFLRHQLLCGVALESDQSNENFQVETTEPLSSASLQIWLGKNLFQHSKFREKLSYNLGQLNLVLEEEFGCGLPDFEVLKGPQGLLGKYQLRLHKQVLGESEIWPDHVLAVGPAEVLSRFGTHSSVEPSSNRSAIWIPPFNLDLARQRGCCYFVEPASVLSAHLGDLLSRIRR
jgi:flagellar biosynthesis component FlhA